MKRSPLVIFAVLALLALYGSAWRLRENEQAIVVQLGEPVGEQKDAGLHFKIPLIQTVVKFEKRLLGYDAAPREVLTLDKKTIVVDNYALWRIVDPLRFFQTLRSMPRAQSRIDDIVYSELRETLGRHELIEIIGPKREDLMDLVTAKSDKQVQDFGITIRDVRIERADLPKENSLAVYARMNAEREREAKRYRSEGEEEAVKIKSEADRDRAVILAEAYKNAEKIRGEGEADAARISAEAYGQDLEFFRFYRRMQAYRKTLKDRNTLVLDAQDEFLRYLGSSDPGGRR